MMRFKLVLFILLPIILLLLIPVLLSINPLDLNSSIRSGDLVYSCNCGWISWDHALPGGVKTLIQEVVHDSSLNMGTKKITYRQNMKINFIGKSKWVAQISRTYILPRVISNKEREEMAFLIFRQTSESFEKMQGSFPFSLNDGSKHSSFKGGDLTGNKIAFYRALRGYSKREVEKFCKPVSINNSIRLLQEGKYGKQHDWQPKQEGAYPHELSTIRTITPNSSEKLLFIKESKAFYIDF